jgi:hypothetical protein
MPQRGRFYEDQIFSEGFLKADVVSRRSKHAAENRLEDRRTCETAGKSGKQIERCVISTFQVAESMGFKGEFRQWEHLPRIESDRGFLCPHSRSASARL